MTLGDSKTTPQEYSITLADLLTNPWRVGVERPAEIAVGGATTAHWAANIDAALAARTDRPDKILINLGVNDLPTWPSGQADTVSNFRYILDALHTWSPASEIGIMRFWQRTYDEECDEFAEILLPQIRDGYEAFTREGPDERVFLENGDNGTTLTDDGLHPNAAGNLVTAAEWLAWIDAI